MARLGERGVAHLRVGLAAGLSALAAWSFRVAFDGNGSTAVLVAILAPVAVAAGWGFLAVPLGRRALGGGPVALAVLAVGVAVAVATRPGADVRLGPSRLLTGTLPAEAAGPELAAVSTVAGFTALLAVRFALGARGVWLPLLPPVVCLSLGLGLGAAVGSPPAWYAPALIVVGMAIVLADRTRGQLVTGGAVVLAAAVAGLTLGPLVATDRPPTSLQALVDAPVRPKEDTNPMARYLALRDNLVPLEITGTGSHPAERIRMVTLDRFTGHTWTIGASYRRAGTRLADPPVPGREVSLDLRVLTPGSVGWLPRVGRPTHISVADMGFDAGTGDVVVPADRETPTAYRITGTEPAIGPDDLGTDDPAIVEPEDASLAPEVLAFLNTATAGRSPGLSEFLGLYQAMSKTGGFSYDDSPQARGGHGVRQIADLVRTRRGTSEQYASMFAVLSRYLGWDARVVLGFRPAWQGNNFRISGSDVFAWVEVRFQRLGWVPVNPSPSASVDEPSQPRQRPESVDVLDEVPPPDQQVPSEPSGPTSPARGVSPPAPDSASTVPVVAAIIAVGVVLFVGLVPLAKRLRRSRARRRGSPGRRTIAAWRETVEALRGNGIAVSVRSTTGQVVSAADGSLRSFLDPLAELVDQASYSREGVADDGADIAWQCTDAIRADLRKTMTPLHKLRIALDPRPLLSAR